MYALSLLLVPGVVIGQGIPIGQWRHHLPNNTIISLSETPGKIIGANRYGLMIYDKNDNSVEKFNKVNGLSDFGISQVVYSQDNNIIFIAYDNGNIDLKRGDKVINIPDIKRASIIGSKRINRVVIRSETAYFATGFGIVKLNMDDLTIRDTYYIGPEGSQIHVKDIHFFGDSIYAATEGGIFRAAIDAPNLADYNYWERVKELPVNQGDYTFITSFAGFLFANLSVSNDNNKSDTLYYHDGDQWSIFDPAGTGYFHPKRQITVSNDKLLIVAESFIDVFDMDLTRSEHINTYTDGTPDPYDAMIDNQGVLWVGDDYHGMVRIQQGEVSQRIRMHGPSSASSFALASSNGNIWVAPGARSPGGRNYWNYDGFFRFTDERWHRYNRFIYEELERTFDIVNVSVDPRNHNRAVICSWYNGIFLFDDFELIGEYSQDNYEEHTLRPRVLREDRLFVSDAVFDSEGNLWVANSLVEKPLSVRKANSGDWIGFDLDGLVRSDWLTGEMLIDDHDQKWLVLPRGNGIIVFRENTLDSENDYDVVRLSTASTRGNLPSNEVTAIAKDKNGYIWVATSHGVVVFYSPNRVFTGDHFEAQPIVLEEDGFVGLLFENETVNAITVDGSNKKWFGTSRAGVFLMEHDGRSTVHHFDVDNSPIPSNSILDIAVEPLSGEVFFATDRGVASYRGYATEGQRQHADVYAYPNPVRPGFNGYIAVKGLVRDAYVKITDINGNLIHETVAEGGQAVWDGSDIRGKRPASGVYLVFSTNHDGSETMVTKILFIN